MKKAGLYIHIPFCIQKCAYCDFFSVKADRFAEILSGSNGSKFARRLTADMDFLAEKYNIGEWDSVYVGGGTPSLLSPDDFYFIFSHILAKQQNPPLEFTVEVNPEDVTKEHLSAAYSSGVNRISVGVQSFSDAVLEASHRRGCREKTVSALTLIKDFNRLLLSCDLIGGLKKQTYTILKDDLKTLLRFSPQHISFYSLCTERKLSDVEDDDIANLWLYGKEFLEKNNYIRYEASNFSYKNLYKSIHNEKYWKLKDYIGIGPGAFGSIFYNFAIKDGKRLPASALRFSAHKNIDKWLKTTKRDSVYEYEMLSEVECIEEFVMMNLRLTEGLDLNAFTARFGFSLFDVIGKTINRRKHLNDLEISASHIRLTDEASIFLNSFLREAFEEIASYVEK